MASSDGADLSLGRNLERMNGNNPVAYIVQPRPPTMVARKAKSRASAMPFWARPMTRGPESFFSLS
jgi:hypothetical protein